MLLRKEEGVRNGEEEPQIDGTHPDLLKTDKS